MKGKALKMKKWLSYIIPCAIIPAFVGSRVWFIFKDKQYAWISLCIVILSCIPFFLHYEKKENDTKKIILIAVMIALSVIGRILFGACSRIQARHSYGGNNRYVLRK